jgi:hypothetical protein
MQGFGFECAVMPVGQGPDFVNAIDGMYKDGWRIAAALESLVVFERPRQVEAVSKIVLEEDERKIEVQGEPCGTCGSNCYKIRSHDGEVIDMRCVVCEGVYDAPMPALPKEV